MKILLEMRRMLNHNFKSKWHFRLKRKCVGGERKGRFWVYLSNVESFSIIFYTVWYFMWMLFVCRLFFSEDLQVLWRNLQQRFLKCHKNRREWGIEIGGGRKSKEPEKEQTERLRSVKRVNRTLGTSCCVSAERGRNNEAPSTAFEMCSALCLTNQICVAMMEQSLSKICFAHL